MGIVQTITGRRGRAEASDFRPTAEIPRNTDQAAIEYLQAQISAVLTALRAPQYLTGASSSDLDNERVVTNTPSIVWDLATASQAKANVQFATSPEHVTGTDTTKAANAAGVRAAMNEGIWSIGTIANAVTLDLGSVHNLRVLVQGNANPSSFGTTPNLIRFVEFDTASIIIHNATTLRCPGGTNITTQAGSRYICTSDASGNWTVWTGEHTNGAMQNANAWQASWGSAYWARGAVTAAATTNLTTSNAPVQTVSGNTGISSFGSGANRTRFLVFTGTPLITHSSALVCPGAVNLQVTAGAWAFVCSDASGNWTIVFYQKADGTATIIADNSITDAKLRDSAALSVIGRASNTSGDPADIAAATDGHILRRSGTAIGFGLAKSAFVEWFQSGTGPSIRTVEDKGRDVLDLRDFPINLTGSNADTAAFQRAINQAQTAKVAIHWPGIAIIDAELSITSGLKMLGNGWPLSQIWVAGNINGLHINTNEGVELEGFQMVGSNNGTQSTVTAGSLIRVTAPDVNRQSSFKRLRLLFGLTSIHFHRAETWEVQNSYLLGHKPTTGVGIVNENVGYPGNGENRLANVLIAGDNSSFTGTGFIDRSSVNTRFDHVEIFQWDNGYVFEPNVAAALAGKYFTNPVFSQVDNAIILNKGSCTSLNHFILIGGQIVARNCLQADSNTDWLFDLVAMGTAMQPGAGNTAGNGTAISLPACKSFKIDCEILGASGDNSVIIGSNSVGGVYDVDLRGSINAPSNSSTTTVGRYSKADGKQYIDKAVRLPTIELGHDTDTTLSRIAAGRMAVEGIELSRIVDVQDFTADGTWTKPANALWVDVMAIGPGGGGGGGARLASGNAGSGGGGGGGGMQRRARFKASDLSATETVDIGTPGSGGAGATVAGNAGSDGTAATSTLFGSKVTAYGGGRGAGGQPAANSGGGGGAGALGAGGDATTSTAGAAGLIGGAAGGAGGAGGSNTNTGLGSGGGGGTTGAAGGAGNHTLDAPCGGGAGGGVAAGPTAFAGGNGGRTAEYSSAAAGGANTGVAGGTPAASTIGPSGGGGGGGGNPSAAGGAGGVGGSYGGGGGGGGAAVGGNGGAGGNGGPGFVRVISYF